MSTPRQRHHNVKPVVQALSVFIVAIAALNNAVVPVAHDSNQTTLCAVFAEFMMVKAAIF